MDVELWPWGMDQGQACKRLEISTSSDQAEEQKRFKKNERINMQETDQHQETRPACSGRKLSDQRSKTEPSSSEPGFKLVGRCELREDTRVCFSNVSFSPRPPFLSPPPPHPAPCRQERLWSRGPPSLGAVTQLRVTIPFGGAASALGFKALVVWGQPASCCSAEELEEIKRIHEACERQPPSPGLFVTSVSQRKPSVIAVVPLRLVFRKEALNFVMSFVVCESKKVFSNSSTDPVPEDFLDPITQEVMVLPMLLPSGMSVDNSTLEEHQKREATWGRAPNDPFTGVPFTSSSRPVPNPQLKNRIDHFLLKNGMTGMTRRLGRGGEGEQLQTSRLVASQIDPSPLESSGHQKISTNHPAIVCDANTRDTDSQMEEHPADNSDHASKPQPASAGCDLALERGNKRHFCGEAEEGLTAVNPQLQPTKRQRADAREYTLLGTSVVEHFLCRRL